jgi:glycosyltransferase involved in cell wall biosynthesis
VKNYFCAADLVAQPYKSATQSGVTQIGYHFNKPMLVTNVGGLSEIIPDKIIGYVTASNPKAISEAILDFFENNRKDEFVTNIKKEKKKFSWSGMISTILEVYNKTFDNDNKK